jgi:hypothetical protein
MRLNIYLYCICSHPTCFGPLLAHHQGCLGLLVYTTIWLMQCCCMSVRSWTVALSYDKATVCERTDIFGCICWELSFVI